MNYRPALYDGSEPLYAPCTIQGGAYWRAPGKYRKAGYKCTSRKLEGTPEERAAMARELTREMVAWGNGEDKKVMTWGNLIARYKTDDVSPFQDVKANTRGDYTSRLVRWENGIGDLQIADATFAEFKRWLRAMQDNGRNIDYIHRQFTMLRMLVGYGVAINPKGPCVEAKAILTEMRIKSPKPRTASPTEAQVLAVIDAAKAGGHDGFALGLLIQWRLTLRAVDVRGQWLRFIGERSGITRGAFRWQDGMTWDMIDRDVTTLTKTPSKTEDAMPEAMVLDLTLTPDLRAELLSTPTESRVGPVITDPRGLPYRRDTWADLWRQYADAVGIPKNVQIRDVRAGAINDAKRKGAGLIQIQQQANHASATTTQRYLREKSDGANNVLKLRSGTP